MTCIIGLAYEGKVYIGGDSASVAGWNVQATALRKVFRLGDFLIGYSGSFRMGQILQHHLSVPDQQIGQSDERYMVVDFIKAVRACLKEEGYAKIDNNRESGAYFLVGYKGAVYQIEDDFQVNHFLEGVASIGSGCEYALGAMVALDHLSPKKRILKALEISAHFCGSVCAPFHVEVLKGEQATT